jgi:hypothetical protein
MQYDLSAMTPATRAVFDSLIALGQGNVIELVEKSGKARSTTDKAIKQLADAGLIVAVDTDADPAEGVPTRWTLAEGVAEAISTDDTGLADGDTAGDDKTDLGDDNKADQPSADDPQPGITPVDGDAAEQDDPDTETDLYDADVENTTGTGSGDDPNGDDESDETEQDSDDDEQDDEVNDEDGDDEGDEEGEKPARASVTVVQQSRPGDRKIMTIKAVLAEYGDDGATLDEIVAESGIGHPTASRLLTAMEQADAARRLPGTPGRWIAGPTKASDVDPNPEPPRCPVCFQVVKGVTESPEAVAQILPLIRPDGTIHVVAEDDTAHVVTLPKRLPPRTVSTAMAGAVRRTDVTVNGDGNQPFAKGDLERLTLAVLAATPGREMTPQEIATEISAQLGGRSVSSGAVRNNCTKAAGAGRIVMVREAPLTFVYPAPAGDGKAAEAATETVEAVTPNAAVEADDASAEQS